MAFVAAGIRTFFLALSYVVEYYLHIKTTVRQAFENGPPKLSIFKRP